MYVNFVLIPRKAGVLDVSTSHKPPTRAKLSSAMPYDIKHNHVLYLKNCVLVGLTICATSQFENLFKRIQI